MVNTAAAFFKKRADRRIFAGRLKKLEPALANRQHRHADLLVLDCLCMDVFEAQSVFPKLQRFVNAPGGDAEVIDLHFSSSFSTAEYGSLFFSAISAARRSSFSLVPF